MGVRLLVLLISFVNGMFLPYKTIMINKVFQEDKATLLSTQLLLSLIFRSLGLLVIADNHSSEYALLVLILVLFFSIDPFNFFTEGKFMFLPTAQP